MNEDPTTGGIRNDLVAVHKKDGKLIKGVLHWQVPCGQVDQFPCLPEVLQIHHAADNRISAVLLADTKAVFFVKSHNEDAGDEEIRFFPDTVTSDLWVHVRLVDGVFLEGRTENGTRLVLEPGFWLKPTDVTTNNVMVYVPKTSVGDFHVMGFAIHSRP